MLTKCEKELEASIKDAEQEINAAEKQNSEEDFSDIIS